MSKPAHMDDVMPPMEFLPTPNEIGWMDASVHGEQDEDNQSIGSFSLTPVTPPISPQLIPVPHAPRHGAVCGSIDGNKRVHSEDFSDEDDRSGPSKVRRVLTDEDYNTPPRAPIPTPVSTLPSNMPPLVLDGNNDGENDEDVLDIVALLDLDNDAVVPTDSRSPTAFDRDFVSEFISDDMICYEGFDHDHLCPLPPDAPPLFEMCFP